MLAGHFKNRSSYKQTYLLNRMFSSLKGIWYRVAQNLCKLHCLTSCQTSGVNVELIQCDLSMKSHAAISYIGHINEVQVLNLNYLYYKIKTRPLPKINALRCHNIERTTSNCAISLPELLILKGINLTWVLSDGTVPPISNQSSVFKIL